MTETATPSVAQLFMFNDQERSVAHSVLSIAVNTDAAAVCNAVRSVAAGRAATSPSASVGVLFLSAVDKLLTSAVEHNTQRRRSSLLTTGGSKQTNRDLQLQIGAKTYMVLVGDI